MHRPTKTFGLLILLTTCLFTRLSEAQYGGGTGEPNDPYLIYTAEQMNTIGAEPNDWDKHFKLMADIDLAQYTGEQFNIIGYYQLWKDSKPFEGVFDGNNYSISHFTYASGWDYIGLFGYVFNGELRNVRLVEPNMAVNRGDYAGSLASYAYGGKITNCSVEGGSVSGRDTVGGLVGRLGSTEMSDCSSTANVSGAMRVGGLIGESSGTVTNCHAAGNVSGTSSTGGLIGYYSGYDAVTACWAHSNVQGNSAVGGLVGITRGNLQGCYSGGHVTGKSNCGGLVGSNEGKVFWCYAEGTVTGVENVGGQLGLNLGQIFSCYSTCAVTGETNVGGFIGRSSGGRIQSCFWDTQTSGVSTSAGGTACSTIQMKTASTFRGWHSDGYWTLNEGLDYPRLAWETRAAAPLTPGFSELYKGLGEPNDPYQIWTQEEFVSIAYRREDWGKHFILMNDLDFSGIDSNEVIPIGDDITEFSGIFDGAGHTIFNYTCRLEELPYIGAFGILVAPTPDPNGVVAVVKNLHLVNAEVHGRDHVGGLVGWNRGTVTGCSVDGNVVGLSTVGSLVGINQGEINTCSSTGTVTSQQDIAGGLVGYNSPIVSNIIGPLLTGNGWAGISKSFSSAQVTGEKNVGGLVGSDNGNIENCYSTGSVTGQDVVGGLVGDSRGRKMSFCYSTSRVNGDTNTGGLAGSRPHHMEDHAFCVWDTDTSNMSISAAGRGKTTEEMMSSKTYYCWGIDDYWTIDEGNDYPHLTWENHTGVPISEYDRLYGGGSGDANDPYLISTPQQLITVGWYEEDYDKHYLLITNLDFNDISSTEIRPIGNDKVAFTGVFEGQGYIISHIKLRSWNRNVGVFGVVGSRIPEGLLRTPWISEVNAPGFVRNLQVLDANLTGYDMQGVLVGFNVNGTISGCSVTGSVGEEGAGDGVLGGLVGRNMGFIDKCRASCYINGGYFVGGLVGSNKGTIQSSYSTGEVTGSALHIGGLSGDNTGVISDCHSQCLVKGYRQVGGFVGSNYNESEIINCSSLGDVSGEEQIGGLVGLNTGSVINSYSAGIINGTGEYIGGLVGNNEDGKGHTTASFWDTETSGLTTSTGGMGLTTEEMQTASTFLEAGWDFVDEVHNGTCDYWQISPYNYPKLRYNIDNRPIMPNGLGTTQQPYLIQNARDLGTVWFESSACYRLEAPIDLSGITWSIPVIPSFGGTFDGNGYTISNLTIIGHRYLGLFGRLTDGAEIKDLGVVDVNIAGSGSNIGSLAGCNKGTITTSFSTGTITGDRWVGGLVGENNGAITASYSTGTVTGDIYVGVLVSENNGAINDCYSTGTATGDRWVGGLIGYNKGEVNDCYSTATVIGNSYVGGLVGSGGWWGITTSFWDIQTSGPTTSSGGTGKTTAEMQMAQTFLEAGWDFINETENGTEDIWWILEGRDYPRLFWEPIPEN